MATPLPLGSAPSHLGSAPPADSPLSRPATAILRGEQATRHPEGTATGGPSTPRETAQDTAQEKAREKTRQGAAAGGKLPAAGYAAA